MRVFHGRAKLKCAYSLVDYIGNGLSLGGELSKVSMMVGCPSCDHPPPLPVQMEAECTQIEEKVLERQIQQETSATFSGSQSDLEFENTTKEKNRLQKAREKIQSDSDSLLPVLNILYLQLQFLQNIQDGTKVGVVIGVIRRVSIYKTDLGWYLRWV